MISFKKISLFSNVRGFNKAFEASENHEKQTIMKDYKLANEVITAIAEKGTILIEGLESDLEDKAVAKGQNCLKFRVDFAGLTEWLSTDLKLVRYVGERKKIVTLSEEGRYIHDNNLTVKEYIERKDKLRADKEATIEHNLTNAKLKGIYTIVKIVGTIIGTILIPLAGVVANDIIRTTVVAIASAIIGALWSTKLGHAIKSFINYFVKD